jgi:hypothetical protein
LTESKYPEVEKMYFSLQTPELELRLRLEDLNKIRIHEEVIPKMLEELVEAIKSDKIAKHPILVDLDTLVALDGMHRIAAFEKLGFKYIPVCMVDYKSPKIKVGCWYRVIKGKFDAEETLNALENLGLEVEKSSVEEVLNALALRHTTAAFRTKNSCYALKSDAREIREIYNWVGEIEKTLRISGLKISYETEADSENMLTRKEADAVLMMPAVKKEEVIEAGISGNVFAHKTTRHVVPARPMHVDVPIEWLEEGDLIDINEKLVKYLSQRKVQRLPPGSLYESRRYEEELWIFE